MAKFSQSIVTFKLKNYEYMKLNEYSIKSRLFPAILTSIPILSLYYFGFSENLIAFMTFLESNKWIGDISLFHCFDLLSSASQ